MVLVNGGIAVDRLWLPLAAVAKLLQEITKTACCQQLPSFNSVGLILIR